jgi:hypothetical protein
MMLMRVFWGSVVKDEYNVMTINVASIALQYSRMGPLHAAHIDLWL